jgi:hypothetical protein
LQPLFSLPQLHPPPLQEHPIPKTGDRTYRCIYMRYPHIKQLYRYHCHPQFHPHHGPIITFQHKRPIHADRETKNPYHTTKISALGGFLVVFFRQPNRRDREYRYTCPRVFALKYDLRVQILQFGISSLTRDSTTDQKILYPDFLGIHMIRDTKSSTIISYHHDLDGRTTSAQDLFTRLKLVGRSVYW